MKKQIVSFMLAISFVLASAPLALSSSDPLSTASAWARDGIQNAIEKGFVPDALQSNYTDIITRAEFCRLVVQYIEYITGRSIVEELTIRGLFPFDPSVFSDTDDSDILSAFYLDIVKGIGNGLFDPDSQFTREQAATVIRNMCGTLGADTSEPPPSDFIDEEKISEWAKNAVDYCAANGIMNGTGDEKFDPQVEYTRQQSIVTLDNVTVYDFISITEQPDIGHWGFGELGNEITREKEMQFTPIKVQSGWLYDLAEGGSLTVHIGFLLFEDGRDDDVIGERYIDISGVNGEVRLLNNSNSWCEHDPGWNGYDMYAKSMYWTAKQHHGNSIVKDSNGEIRCVVLFEMLDGTCFLTGYIDGDGTDFWRLSLPVLDYYQYIGSGNES